LPFSEWWKKKRLIREGREVAQRFHRPEADEIKGKIRENGCKSAVKDWIAYKNTLLNAQENLQRTGLWELL